MASKQFWDTERLFEHFLSVYLCNSQSWLKYCCIFVWVTGSTDEEQIVTIHRISAERFCSWGYQKKTKNNSSPTKCLKSQISSSNIKGALGNLSKIYRPISFSYQRKFCGCNLERNLNHLTANEWKIHIWKAFKYVYSSTWGKKTPR